MTGNKSFEVFQCHENFLSINYNTAQSEQPELIKYDATFTAHNNEPYHCEHTTLHNTEYIQLTP